MKVESCWCPAGGGVGRGGGWLHSHGVDMQQEEQMSCAAVRRLGMFNQMDDAGEYFHCVKRRGEKWSEPRSPGFLNCVSLVESGPPAPL